MSLDDLNSAQREAVHFISGPLLVIAGAGSGKTRVITQKLCYLIEECGYPQNHLFAVTFTNKAAREMQTRLKSALNQSKRIQVEISTFHTLGLNILKQSYPRIGKSHKITILDQEDALSLLHGVLPTEHGRNELMDALTQISKWKNQSIDATQALSIAENELQQNQAILYGEYQKSLEIYHAVDFDDLIARPVQLLQEYPELKEYWQNQVRYMMVDEYQDTNPMQYALMKLLVGPRGYFTAVGDDDQAIYAWRGADSAQLLHLKEDYSTLKTIKLEQNYRSTGAILNTANHLISHNTHLFEKKLWSSYGYGEKIQVVHTVDEQDEAHRIASEIMHHQFKHRTSYGDYAVLYRGNYQAKPFEEALRSFQIPYQVSGGESFFARKEIKDLAAYLRLMVNNDDDTAFLRVINTPRREIGAQTLEKLACYANERQISLFAAIFEVGLTQHLSERGVKALSQFGHWMNFVSDEASRSDTYATILEMVKTIGYFDWLFETSSTKKVAEKKIENVNEFLGWIKRWLEGDEANEPLSLEALVTRMLLLDLLSTQEDKVNHARVQLMTLHAAKGLEFPYVYIAGFEEGLLPHQNSIEQNQIEEERRLLYVGLTRAKRQLTLTRAKKRKHMSETTTTVPSRFLEELPVEDREEEGLEGVPQSQDARQKKGEQVFSDLLSMLNAKS